MVQFAEVFDINYFFYINAFFQLWDPEGIPHSKLVIFFRAANSMTSYNGYFENSHESGPCIIDKSLNMISEDLPLAHAHNVVRHQKYTPTDCFFDDFAHWAPSI